MSSSSRSPRIETLAAGRKVRLVGGSDSDADQPSVDRDAASATPAASNDGSDPETPVAASSEDRHELVIVEAGSPDEPGVVPPESPPPAGDEVWPDSRVARPCRSSDPLLVLVYHNLDRQFDALLGEIQQARSAGVSVNGVHHVRTACRRTRATIKSFRDLLPKQPTQSIAAELSWLAGVLGRVRDLDVQREGIARHLAESPGELADGLEPYLRQLADDHASVCAELREALGGERVRKLLIAFDGFLDREPVPATLRRWASFSAREGALEYAERARKRVRKIGRRIDRKTSPDRLHKLRIRCKRLRYLLECFEPIHGDRLQGAIQSVRHLQDTLGEFQDASVAIDRMASELRTAETGSLNEQNKLAFAELMRLQELRANEARQEFRKGWRRFEKRLTRRKLRRLLDRSGRK
jgi:CHAD domain-containing protein